MFVTKVICPCCEVCGERGCEPLTPSEKNTQNLYFVCVGEMKMSIFSIPISGIKIEEVFAITFIVIIREISLNFFHSLLV